MRNAAIARSYLAYWVVDTGSQARQDARAKKDVRRQVEAIGAVPATVRAIPKGVTAFSPAGGPRC
jgi:hypothetical protein